MKHASRRQGQAYPTGYGLGGYAQSQQDSIPNMDLLQQIGAFNDPMQEVGGLVQLANAMQAPDLADAELQLKQQAQANQVQQFGQSLGLQQQELALRGQGQTQSADQFVQSLAAQKQARDDAWLQHFASMDQQNQHQKLQGILSLIGLSRQGLNPPPMNPSVLNRAAEAAGPLMGLPSLAGLIGGGGQQDGMPAGLSPEQQVKWRAAHGAAALTPR